MLAAITIDAVAQGSTNSPYSQYGLGVLADQSQGFNRGMNGVGIGMQNGNQVNTLNPASYSGVDSLTMIFDAGLSGQLTNFKEGGTRVNAKNANFEYMVGSFRAFRNVGIGFGVLPYTNIDYSYSTSTYPDNSVGSITESYSGSGGLHEVFVGVGARLLKPLSVGANIGYLWGDYDKSVVSGYGSSGNLNSMQKIFTANIHSYKLDLGVQWQQPLGKKDVLTVGATWGIGHKLSATPQCDIINVSYVNSSAIVADSTSFKVEDGLSLPTSYGVGLALAHDNKLTVGADMVFQKWGKLDYPDFGSGNTYDLRSGLLKDSYRVNVGGEWVPNERSRKFLSRVHYRLGAGYATPYYYINSKEGPKELSVSAGFGIPIMNTYNNRSLLNISAQWAQRSADGLLTENTFRINIGLTFNERWFMKWKVE